MDSNRQQARRRLIVLMDLGSIVVSMALAALTHSTLRDHFSIFKDPPSAGHYLLIAFLTVPFMLGLVAALGLDRQFERPFQFWSATLDQVRLHIATLVGITLIVFLTQVPLNRTIVGLFLTTASS